jgi:hypothetical protein
MIVSVAAQAQRGDFSAVISNTPNDYVKTALLKREMNLGWIIQSEGIDSIRIENKGEKMTIFFETRGQNTLLSYIYCHGDDCHAVAQLHSKELQDGVQKMADDFEHAYAHERDMQTWRNSQIAFASTLQKPRVFVGNVRRQLLEDIQIAKKERPDLKVDSLVEGRIVSRVTGYEISPVKRFGVDGSLLAKINSGDTITASVWTANDMSINDYQEVVRELGKQGLGPATPTWQYDTDHQSGWQGYLWNLYDPISMLTYDAKIRKLSYTSVLGSSLAK